MSGFQHRPREQRSTIRAGVPEAAAVARPGLEELRVGGGRLPTSERELWPQAQGRVTPLKDLGQWVSAFQSFGIVPQVVVTPTKKLFQYYFITVTC